LVVAADGAPPRLRLERLPIEDLVPLFVEFLAEASELGTDVMRTDAGALASAPLSARVALFGVALTGAAAEETTPFHVRAFLQPVVTALAEASAVPGTSEGHRPGALRTERCPVCGATPVVATIDATTEKPDRRGLVCGVCGVWWAVARVSCGRCGETDPEWLLESALRSPSHLLLDECQRCGRYRKTVDLRACPEAVPLVDDLASVEVDLGARRRGLARMEPSLLGP
jgi:formate dehydrogenase maturation protein FdhE